MADKSQADATQFDLIVVGGGHGLVTADDLAKTHGVRRGAALEKGWIGDGNTGRNATVIRSNSLSRKRCALRSGLAALRWGEPRAELQRHAQPARDADRRPQVNAIAQWCGRQSDGARGGPCAPALAQQRARCPLSMPWLRLAGRCRVLSRLLGAACPSMTTRCRLSPRSR